MSASKLAIPSMMLLPFCLLPSVALYAQQEYQMQPRGVIEIGIRQLAGDRESSKFTEYRDIPIGFFLRNFEMSLDDVVSTNTFLNFQSRGTLRKDQSYRLALGQYGNFQFEFLWDRTPHYFTNKATTLFQQSGPGVFTLPGPTRTLLQSSAGNLPQVLAGSRPLNVSLGRNKGSGIFQYTPNADWTVRMQYSREEQSGSRPIGTTTNSFSNVVELPEPIDYRTTEAKASVEYRNDRGGFEAGYSASLFTNKVSEIVWDIPFLTADTASTGSRGRLDLYPDNSAHSVGFAGALNLSDSTRLMVSISPGWMRQNDPFLPFTINRAVAGVPELPARSLNGSKQRLAMNYTVASNPVPKLVLAARYRSYDYNNNTPSLVFSNYVRTDAALSGLARRNLPFGYNRQNAGMDASYELWKGHAVKAGYEWERMDREHRDVPLSTEHTLNAGLDLKPKKWLWLKASFAHANREPSHYEANEETFPLGEGPFALGQLGELRKFDQAARSQNRAEALLQLDAGDAWSVTASYGTTQNRYRDSLYGRSFDRTFNLGADVSYQPHPDISLFAEYMRENYRTGQRSRQRNPPSATAAANDSTNNDWESRGQDLVDTWGGGITLSGLRQKVTWDNSYSLSAARGSIATRALGTAAVPGFLVTTARDYPNTYSRFHALLSAIRIPVRTDASLKFEYRYERYGRVDFQVAPMIPNMVGLDASTNTSIFLGADVPGFNAHIFEVKLEYHF